MTWIGKSYENVTILRKWRFFIDAKTNLPQRTELYNKLPADSEYNLVSVKVVEYLSDSEIQSVLEACSF